MFFTRIVYIWSKEVYKRNHKGSPEKRFTLKTLNVANVFQTHKEI